MELPFDLSEVVFLCTVNDLGALSAPLRDRLEVIELSGYTPDEKIAIARSHLVPKQLKEHAIDPGSLSITVPAGASALITNRNRDDRPRRLNAC